MSTTTGAFIAGGIAACGAVTATHPFETVKIRLQLQGELQSADVAVKKYRGVFHGVNVIVRNEGLRGIYRGIGCAYVYQVLLNGCRLGFYEPLRAASTKLIFKDSNVQSLGVNIFSGAASGILGAMAGSPFFLVKTRLQSFSPFLPVGTQHTYKNAADGFAQIYKAEGVKGLYRGMGASMVRTGAGSSVQLPTYFFAKRRLMRHAGMTDGPALHLLSSTASGFVVCCVMHPPVSCPLSSFFFFYISPTQLTYFFYRTPSWPVSTINMETSTVESLTVFGKPSLPKASCPSTRVSLPISPESFLTPSSP